MKNSRLAVLIALSVACLMVPVFATAGSIWSVPGREGKNYQKSLLTVDGGAGAYTAPSTESDGIDLATFKTFDLVVEVDIQVNTAWDIGYWWQAAQDAGGQAANTIANGCTLAAYLYNPIVQKWIRRSTLDVSLSTAAGQTKAIVQANTIPTTIGRLAFIPQSACTVPLKTYLVSRP